MDRTQDFVADSLELHLFFGRIMKEHAFFLKVGFLNNYTMIITHVKNLMKSLFRHRPV